MPTFGTNSQTFLTNGTFTVPSGVTSITVECWGGGGSGGRAVGVVTAYQSKTAGGGGGGGAYARSTLSVTPATSYTVTVGAAQTTSGTDGNDSWFGSTSTVFAKGGGGGGNKTEVSGVDTLGNLGLGASAAACIGSVKYSGGNGSGFAEEMNGYSGWSGAGGGGAGNTQDGFAASSFNDGVSGSGGSELGGNGANGVTPGNAGVSGFIYGGGGSGGHTRDITIGQRQGGAGAQGLVKVWWTPVTYPTTRTICTTCNPIVEGCYMYLSGNTSLPAPSGYYYSGSSCYNITDGYVTTVTNYYYYNSTRYNNDCSLAAVGNIKLRSVHSGLSGFVCGDDGLPYQIDSTTTGPTYDINVSNGTTYGSCISAPCYTP